jgi:hypothetical protein
MNFNRRFGGEYRFLLQGLRVTKAREQHEHTSKTLHIFSAGTLVDVHQNGWSYFPEDRTL